MKYVFVFLVFILCFCPLFAQFADDFSNGNFTEDPPWVGDHDKFIVDDGFLRLYEDEAGVAWLSTESQALHNTQWDFWVRIAFTPSDNNHPRIYLVSNQSDLSLPLNGYFIQIGKTGGDMKRVFFCRQDGAEVTTLMTGSMNLAEGTNTVLRIRVLRDGAGNWNVLAAQDGGSVYIPQGQVFDNTYQTSLWFGIRCTYTVSNSRRFYFDDFRVGAIVPGDAPEVIRLQVVSETMLDVHFNTVLHASTAQQTSHYHVDGDVGHPLVAALNPEQPNLVRLQFFQGFTENHLYQILIHNIMGADGQLMEPYEGNFVNFAAQRFDVVFNEIMANSRPEVALPPHDWIELYNTTELPIDIEGWILQHGDTQRELPWGNIPPKGYLALTTESAYPEFASYDNILAVPGLSATAFTIGGTSLSLWDNNGDLVSFVHYSGGWYRDNAKANGGWSLEKIDPYNFGQGSENWKASEDTRGGTPGETNSVRGTNPNKSAPRMTRAGYVDSLTIRLHFSEPMHEASLLSTSNYSLDHGMGHPALTETFPPDFTRVDLTLDQPLTAGITYKVETTDSLKDCDGNMIGRKKARVAIPGSPQHGGIVINEVLFNPLPGGARYVELHNRSERVFDLQEMILASRDTVENLLTSLQQISEESLLIFPGDYLVFSNDTGAVSTHYQTPAPDALWELNGMPRMTNSWGTVALATQGHFVIDMLTYDESMHLPLIANPAGVALERLHPDRPSHEASSWHSAAASAGYGTPGYRNSQYMSQHDDISGHWEVDPRIFIPDGSGHKDMLHMYYSLEEPGYVAHIRVFDRRGRKVRTLTPGKLLAAEGVVTWDGTTDSGEKATVGVYVIHIEMVHHQGRVSTEKLWAVVGAQL